MSQVWFFDPKCEFIFLRVIQFLATLVYLSCLTLSAGSLSGSTYASLEPVVSIGVLLPSSSHGRSKRVVYLLIRLAIELLLLACWLLLFLLAQSKYPSMPYKTWVASVVVAFVQWIFFAVTAFMILLCHLKAPPRAPIITAADDSTANNQPPAHQSTDSTRSSVPDTVTVFTAPNDIEPAGNPVVIGLATLST
ncbi:MAG: hypothetical protein Q9219_000837 [cf. Caloplaca sp. 3 TL-2023]